MASITVKCPECDLSMKVDEEKVGKKVRCKECDHIFVAKAPAAKSASSRKDDKGARPPAKSAGKGDKNKAITAKPPDKGKPAPKKSAGADDEEDPNPYGINEVELGVRCPECANEMESEEAVVCLHCGFNTQTRTRASTRKVKDITGGEVFLWLLPGILSVLGIIVFLVLMILYTVYSTQWFHDEWYEFLSYYPFKLWFWIIFLFLTFKLGRFGIKRLIIQNSPPEVEVK